MATGTPDGICTVEYSESAPASCSLKMGTPITGRMVFAAMTPARWAARPAAAMMTSRPRSSASLAYSWAWSGVRWALMTCIS